MWRRQWRCHRRAGWFHWRRRWRWRRWWTTLIVLFFSAQYSMEYTTYNHSKKEKFPHRSERPFVAPETHTLSCPDSTHTTHAYNNRINGDFLREGIGAAQLLRLRHQARSQGRNSTYSKPSLLHSRTAIFLFRRSRRYSITTRITSQ